jgi:hypothetical protein
MYNQIVNSRGSFERMLERLPGFEGYLDRQARRSADRMLRDNLAQKVDERIKRLASIERKLLDKGGLASMPKTQSVKTKLQTYHDRLKAAPLGYRGFFDALKIDSEALDMLYGFDELQITYMDKIAQGLDALDQAVNAGSGVDEAIAALDQLSRDANDAFSRRDDSLKNLGIAKE